MGLFLYAAPKTIISSHPQFDRGSKPLATYSGLGFVVKRYSSSLTGG